MAEPTPDLDECWPECCDCGEEYNPRRAALGYDYCLACAPKHTGKPAVFRQEVSKSNELITSNSGNVCMLAGREGSSAPGPVKFVRIAGTAGWSCNNSTGRFIPKPR